MIAVSDQLLRSISISREDKRTQKLLDPLLNCIPQAQFASTEEKHNSEAL